ncbi:polysaccharide deacetylase family protein [Virgibacillus proomii]|jgi:peptidoglycan/xylan/chitin deacetylase (PgdA/CDA1 family)|uniref:polysaccharide deacetylase family protein n=1 Tax=Virgibacillus proomii TaxID=84407 RepID=UPI000985DED7|nr:polysaccharide deacetylase family protein [Virgibacillus proomii]
MRKVGIIIALIIAILLAGCANENDENNQSTKEENPKAVKETGSQVEHNSQNTEDKQENAQVNKKKVTEQDDSKYTVAENATIVPINKGINKKVVLLTIDDVPDKYALDMAKTLKQLDANAIFFVNGHFLETKEQRDVLKQIHDMGFVIGNHTYSHAKLPDLAVQEQTEEIVKVSDQIEEIIGERPKFFRAPHGMNTDHSKQVAKEEDMIIMNWTYGYDYFAPYQDAKKLTKAMVSGEGPEVEVPYSLLKPGANLLMHDREWTNQALKDIVTGLREKGYEMVDPHTIKTLN